MMEEALRDLVDKQAITDVLHRYCRAVDRQDREALQSVYHPDAEDFHGVYNGPISGLIKLRPDIGSSYIMTSHMIGNIQIELVGDRAHVESYLSAVHRASTPEGLRDDFLRCRYIDRFERRDSEWRIARRVVVYDWGESRPAADKAWWDFAPGDYIFGQRGADDRRYAERDANLGKG